MENLDRYKIKIKEVESLIVKLENGSLNIQELSSLEALTRELHERSIILKYKAFENHVGIVKEEVSEEPVVDSVVEEVGPTSLEKDVVKEEKQEDLMIDFSIFEEPSEKPEATNDFVAKAEEKEEVKEEAVVPEIKVENEEKALNDSAPKPSFWEQLDIPNTSVSNQFEGAKLDTLVGAFGLNEKLRYINDLFDGSSEHFSEAVKALDNQSSIDEAKVKSSELASKHNWDAEDEAVVDFMIMVNRRYA